MNKKETEIIKGFYLQETKLERTSNHDEVNSYRVDLLVDIMNALNIKIESE